MRSLRFDPFTHRFLDEDVAIEEVLARACRAVWCVALKAILGRRGRKTRRPAGTVSVIIKIGKKDTLWFSKSIKHMIGYKNIT